MTYDESRVSAMAAAVDLPIAEEELPDLARRLNEIGAGLERLAALTEDDDRPLTVYRPADIDD